MLFLSTWTTSLFLLGIGVLASPVEVQPHTKMVKGREIAGTRVLKARKRDSVLHARDESTVFIPRSSLEMDYADDTTVNSQSQFKATVLMKPKRPAIVLEGIDHFLNHVQCTSSQMTLGFESKQHLQMAQDVWIMPEFIIFTSHQGCNDGGERRPYLVSAVMYDHSRAMATLTTKSIDWAKAYKSLEVDFGRNTHYGQGPENKTPSAPLSKRASTQDINFSKTDVSLFSIDGVSTSCKSCVGTGAFTFERGSFKLFEQADTVEGPPEDIRSLVEFATVDIVANNVAASFDLETQVGLAIQKSFSFHLLGENGEGVSIPGLGSIGAIFDPQIVSNIDVFGLVDFTYGFNMSIPNGAQLTIDLVHPSSSAETGFDATVFSALPFNIIDTQIGANISIAFRPVIELGLSILGQELDPLTVFADVPKYEASLILEEGGVNPCSSSAGSNLNLLYNSDLAFDIGVGAQIDVLDLLHFNPSKVLLSTTVFPVATCVALGAGAVPSSTVTGGGFAPTGTGGVYPTGSGGVYPTASGSLGGTAPWQNGTYTAPLPTAATMRRRF